MTSAGNFEGESHTPGAIFMSRSPFNNFFIFIFRDPEKNGPALLYLWPPGREIVGDWVATEKGSCSSELFGN